MAEIEMERRPRRRGWIWVVMILLVAALAVGAWFYLTEFNGVGDATPAVDTRPVQEADPEIIIPEPAPATRPPDTLGDPGDEPPEP